MTPAPAAEDSGAGPRAAAARALAAVLGRGQALDEALVRGGRRIRSARDRAQVQALAYGASRWHHRHRALLSYLLDRPLRSGDAELEALLSVGLFQLRDGGQPDYAAVSATVEAARLIRRPQAAGLVNAALRRYLRERDACEMVATRDPATQFSHPEWLATMLAADWPHEEEWLSVLAANQCHPPQWVRLHAGRVEPGRWCEELKLATGVTAAPVPGMPHAFKLAAPVPMAELPGYAAGLVSVQDLASQLAAEILAPTRGMRVLDACAAPGGKTAHLLERAGGDLDLTAVDISARRLGDVANYLDRVGLRATLIEADAVDTASWWDGRPFDAILLDAPCSATGAIRRHPDIKLLRRASDIAPLAARQQALLDALWPLLRRDGRLLYTTCSVLRTENEQVVGGFLTATTGSRALPLPALPPLAAARVADPGRQLLPGGPADTDGFYYCLLAMV